MSGSRRFTPVHKSGRESLAVVSDGSSPALPLTPFPVVTSDDEISVLEVLISLGAQWNDDEAYKPSPALNLPAVKPFVDLRLSFDLNKYEWQEIVKQLSTFDFSSMFTPARPGDLQLLTYNQKLAQLTVIEIEVEEELRKIEVLKARLALIARVQQVASVLGDLTCILQPDRNVKASNLRTLLHELKVLEWRDSE